MKAPAIGAVIMAAGAGRRMGGVPKPLLERDGEPLLLRQIRLAAEVGIEAIVVVLGHHAAQLHAVLERARSSADTVVGARRASWVVNPDPDAGTGSSLRCGLRALPSGLAAWLVMLGDQPLLEADDARAVLRAWSRRPAGIELVVPVHAGQPGHPIVFGSCLRQAVIDAHGGWGVREWRRGHPERVVTLTVAHPRCTTDVDTPADVDRLHAEHGVLLGSPSGPAPADPRR